MQKETAYDLAGELLRLGAHALALHTPRLPDWHVKIWLRPGHSETTIVALTDAHAQTIRTMLALAKQT